MKTRRLSLQALAGLMLGFITLVSPLQAASVSASADVTINTLDSHTVQSKRMPEVAEVTVPGTTNTSAVMAPGDDATSSQIKKLVSRMEDLVESKDERESLAARGALEQLNAVTRCIATKDYRNALSICESMHTSARAQPVRVAINDLTVTIRAQIRAEASRATAQAQAYLAQLPSLCAKAKSADDLQMAAENIKRLQSLISSLASDYNTPDMQVTSENLSNAQNFITQWTSYLSQQAFGDSSRAYEILNRLMTESSYATFVSQPEIAKLVEGMQASMRADMERLLAKTREGLKNAKTSAELQTVQTEFERQSRRLQRVVSNDGVVQSAFEAMRHSLQQWARVMAAEDRGDIQAALQALSNMEGDYSSRYDAEIQKMVAAKKETLMSRLAEEPARPEDPMIKSINEQVASADTIEKMISLRRKLSTLPSGFNMGRGSSSAQQEIQYFLADLQTLEGTYALLQARQFGQVLQNYSAPMQYSHRWKVATGRCFNQIRARALAEVYDLKDIPLTEEQALDQALLAMADKAAAAKQWDKLGRCMEAYRIAAFGFNQPFPAPVMDDINACRTYLAAVNFEKAEEIERAALNYLDVLNTTSKRGPVPEATEGIARLRKEYPKRLENLDRLPLSGAPSSGGLVTPVITRPLISRGEIQRMDFNLPKLNRARE